MNQTVAVVLFAVWASIFLVLAPFSVSARADSRTTSSTSTPPKEVPIPNTCSSFYRNTRRSGAFLIGQFTIPVDSQFPKYKIQVKFNRQIQGLTVRQTKAKDINGHREYSIEPLEPENGQIVLSSVVRVSRSFLTTFSRTGLPRVNRIVLNGKTLCAVSGEPIVDETATVGYESVIIETKPSKKKTKPSSEKWDTSKSKDNNDFEDDEDEPFDFDAVV